MVVVILFYQPCDTPTSGAFFITATNDKQY